MKGNVSIQHDERDFWHVNFFLIHEDPGDDGDVPDAVATTKKGATRDDAISLARRKFDPVAITVWDTCESCGGSGVTGDTEIDWQECDECEDGLVPTNI